MTKTKKLRVLREIYDTIPSPGCKGLCVSQCSTIPVFPIELEQLEEVAGRKLPSQPVTDLGGAGFGLDRGRLLGDQIGDPCPLLVLGRCSVYEHRPLICRAFGSVEGLRCPHGCRPDRLLTDADQYQNFEKVAKL